MLSLCSTSHIYPCCQAAKEAGLNFHVLCFIWLFDVGITEKSASGGIRNGHRVPPLDVPKYLNRCLGMNLPKQKLMTDHFLRHLEKEILLAKRAGEYDIGIKTVSGHNCVIEKPRSFCFRGLEAKDERVLLYKAVVDRGMDSETALNLYNEAKEFDGQTGNVSATTSTGGCLGGYQVRRIHSGFYIDRRDIFKEVPRMFLIINQGRTSGKCVVIRPNEGKKLYSKEYVWNKLLNGDACRLSKCTDVTKATETWDREFQLADRPANERYQVSGATRPRFKRIHALRCLDNTASFSLFFFAHVIPIESPLLPDHISVTATEGTRTVSRFAVRRVVIASRHSSHPNITSFLLAYVFGGAIVPILNKLLIASDHSGVNNATTMPSIVRVEPSGKSHQATAQTEGANQDGGAEGVTTPSSATDDSQSNHFAAVGQNVACEMLGSSIFRGVITEVSSCFQPNEVL